jgi:hypothetical protein
MSAARVSINYLINHSFECEYGWMIGFVDARIRQSGYAERKSYMTNNFKETASINRYPSIQLDEQSSFSLIVSSLLTSREGSSIKHTFSELDLPALAKNK